MKYEYAMFFIAAVLSIFAWEKGFHANARADYVREISGMSDRMLRESLDLIMVERQRN